VKSVTLLIGSKKNAVPERRPEKTKPCQRRAKTLSMGLTVAPRVMYGGYDVMSKLVKIRAIPLRNHDSKLPWLIANCENSFDMTANEQNSRHEFTDNGGRPAGGGGKDDELGGKGGQGATGRGLGGRVQKNRPQRQERVAHWPRVQESLTEHWPEVSGVKGGIPDLRNR